MKEETLSFKNKDFKLEGVLRYPDQLQKPVGCLLFIHGSMEHDRDGDLLKTPDNKQAHKKNFLELSRRLCAAGFATFSWDKRGFGKSEGPSGDYYMQAEDARAAYDLLCSRPDIVDADKIAVFGQSAGVLVACLLAKVDNRPCAYVLSGGLYSDYKVMGSFNFHRARDYAAKSPENLEWVEKHDLWGLVVGLNLEKKAEAIKRGEKEFRMEYKGHVWVIPLNPKLHSEEEAPRNQFKYIKSPTLVIHGDADLNVPVQDAEKVEAELRRWGNNNVKRVIIDGADHSFQQTAPDEETRIRERMSLESFKRPYVESYYQHIIDFLKERFSCSA